MAETEGFKTIFKPWLEMKLNQSFPDPTLITGENRDEQFLYEAKTVSLYKKVVAEILMFVQNEIERAKFLRDKEKNKKQDPFAIGGEQT